MECSGGDLLDLIEDTQGGLGHAQASPLLSQLMETVAYLHGRCVAHRDIKPENLLLSDAQRRLRLVDFGLAKDFSKTSESTMSTKVGTFGFSAPEVLSGSI